MQSTRLHVALAFALVLTACSGTATPTTATAPTPTVPASTTAVPSTTTTVPPPPPIAPAATASPTTTRVENGSLVGIPLIDPAACEFGSAPDGEAVEITFAFQGFLLASDSNGTTRCLVPFENQESLQWGPAADRLLLDSTRVTADAAFADVVGNGAVFTRPTGSNLIWVEDGRLWKAVTDGSALREISFLPEHVSVAYHPAGVEIATVGVDDDGRFGVWVSRNDGTEVQRVVTAEEATISEVAFSEDSGFFLSFIAQHENGVTHLHELLLMGADGVGIRNEFDASIALESNTSISGIVTNPWSDEIAVTEGSCADGTDPKARLPQGGSIPAPLTDMATEALAWLPDFELLIAAYPEGCDGPRDLWIVGTGEGLPTFDDPVLLVRDVGVAAVRTAFPEPPQPLGEIDLDDFA